MGCIGSGIYGDDFALCCSDASDDYVEDAMQEAVHCAEKHVSRMGLRLSPSMSEMLLYRPTRRGPKQKVGSLLRRLTQGVPKWGLASTNEVAHASARGLAGRTGHWEVSVPGGTDDGPGAFVAPSTRSLATIG
ncbi:hypothetical protein HPB50_008060 [Hyalomma asiaticum]|uniref:Uncharacterized protein n=1 Tax=Hyalomma asiaticum TaxID=266040 RepID=A0ACB7SFV1_HYAAI|nr:hypothetical protein HPB50_008060 [Hyalomma asiaticum]